MLVLRRLSLPFAQRRDGLYRLSQWIWKRAGRVRGLMVVVMQEPQSKR